MSEVNLILSSPPITSGTREIQDSMSFPTLVSNTMSNKLTTPSEITTMERENLTNSTLGDFSTNDLDVTSYSKMSSVTTNSLEFANTKMVVVEGHTNSGLGVQNVSLLFNSTVSPNKTITDSSIGAILQVLLNGDPLTDDASIVTTTLTSPAGTREQQGATVTTDMQYSIVTNLTNLTFDIVTNATFAGGGGGGTGGGWGSLNGEGVNSSFQTGQYSLHEGILIGIILSLIIFFSVAGNVVVCAAILSDRNLRKTSNYFIISLAVADMLVASMVMSFAVANDILGYWIFGETFCSVWISLDIMCSTASILNLCAISLDRYIHIRSPLHYELWVTPLKTCLFISGIWITSGLMSFVPIHLGWHQLGLSTKPTEKPQILDAHYVCMMELNPWYAVISSIVSFYMPCLVMIAIYLKLHAYARKHVASMKTQIRTPMLQNGSSSSKAKQSNYKVADHKAAITLGVIMGTFLFCWTPFFTINIVGAFCPVCIPTVVFQVFTWLGYFNSTLNPIIYSIFNKEFRDAFKRVLTFRRCCCFQREADFRRPIEYTDAGAYGTVGRKGNPRFCNDNTVTAV